VNNERYLRCIISVTSTDDAYQSGPKTQAAIQIPARAARRIKIIAFRRFLVFIADLLAFKLEDVLYIIRHVRDQFTPMMQDNEPDRADQVNQQPDADDDDDNLS
jgi:hypothetical protein